MPGLGWVKLQKVNILTRLVFLHKNDVKSGVKTPHAGCPHAVTQVCIAPERLEIQGCDLAVRRAIEWTTLSCHVIRSETEKFQDSG